MSNNSETKILTKLTCLIVILAAIISPYIYHDRLITEMKTDIKYIRNEVDNIAKVLLKPPHAVSQDDGNPELTY